MTPSDSGGPARVRMTGAQRREQLIEVALEVFAEKGYSATSVEEVAHRGRVSKPMVYEHFGGKEGLYAAVVDREMRELLGRITAALTEITEGPLAGSSISAAQGAREVLSRAAGAFLCYVDEHAGGFRVLVRDSPVAGAGTFSSLLGDVAVGVEQVLSRAFDRLGLDGSLAGLYSQALIGMVALTEQWHWDSNGPDRHEIAEQLVNLAWYGLSGIDQVGGFFFGGPNAR